ncbi:MAG TPA: ScpA family protein [Oculatellaceae cyanobacterium]
MEDLPNIPAANNDLTAPSVAPGANVPVQKDVQAKLSAEVRHEIQQTNRLEARPAELPPAPPLKPEAPRTFEQLALLIDQRQELKAKEPKAATGKVSTRKPSKPRSGKTSAALRTHTSSIDKPNFDDTTDAADIAKDILDSLVEEGVPVGGFDPRVVTDADGQPVISVQQQDGARRSLTAESADGIEILVKLAAAGEFDPKNIDIIDVTDKFLKAIAAAPKENLRQSGKILFHASVLLRMKAEALLAAAVQDVDAQDDFLEFDENGSGLIYDSRKEIVGRQITLEDLERALVRKTQPRQHRQRKVTLDQLIDALREAEKIERKRADKKPPRAVIELAGQHEARDVDDLLDLAHDEDIEDTIERIENMLVEHTTTGDLISLLVLIKMLDGNGDWVDAFLAVLFLSNAGKITLEQKEFYGPLYLVRNNEQGEGQGQDSAKDPNQQQINSSIA